jgi:hypothetical protein
MQAPAASAQHGSCTENCSTAVAAPDRPVVPPGHGRPDTFGRFLASRLPSWIPPYITRYSDSANGVWDMDRQRLS